MIVLALAQSDLRHSVALGAHLYYDAADDIRICVADHWSTPNEASLAVSTNEATHRMMAAR